jgi:hypothetical protein
MADRKRNAVSALDAPNGLREQVLPPPPPARVGAKLRCFGLVFLLA